MKNNKKEKISYFGYGAMTSPKLMEILLGRKVRGKKAWLYNHGIFINRWEEIPSQARRTLKQHWDRRFSHYSIKMRRGNKVEGKLYQITKVEREVIANWNLFDEGMFTPLKVLVRVAGGKEVLAETETFFTSSSEIQYSKNLLPNFINGRKLLEVAEKYRTI